MKAFSKLRRGSGCTYFITACSVIEKVRIDHAELALRFDLPIEGTDGHACETCTRELNEQESEIVDNLSDLETTITKETLCSLVYIAGYVMKGTDCVDDTTCYYERYGDYLKNPKRGGLTIPSDKLVQWTISCVILINQLPGEFCWTFLLRRFRVLAKKHSLNISEGHSRKLANISAKKNTLY